MDSREQTKAAIEELERSVEDRPIDSIPIWSIICIIAAFFVAYFFAAYASIENWTERGQFGDMFGAMNAFVTGVTLAVVAKSLLLQRKELKFAQLESLRNRLEMIEQKEQMIEQKEQMAKQADALERQIQEMQDARTYERVPILRVTYFKLWLEGKEVTANGSAHVSGEGGACEIVFHFGWRDKSGRIWWWHGARDYQSPGSSTFDAVWPVEHARLARLDDLWLCTSYRNLAGGSVAIWQRFRASPERDGSWMGRSVYFKPVLKQYLGHDTSDAVLNEWVYRRLGAGSDRAAEEAE